MLNFLLLFFVINVDVNEFVKKKFQDNYSSIVFGNGRIKIRKTVNDCILLNNNFTFLVCLKIENI